MRNALLTRRYLVLLALMTVSGCKSAPNPAVAPEKSIVQKVEDAGISPKDLAHADAAGLQVWFLQHTEVARDVADQCKAAMKDDTAWKTSDEGRICLGDKFANYGAASSK